MYRYDIFDGARPTFTVCVNDVQDTAPMLANVLSVLDQRLSPADRCYQLLIMGIEIRNFEVGRPEIDPADQSIRFFTHLDGRRAVVDSWCRSITFTS